MNEQLFDAFNSNNIEMVRLLIELGADIDTTDNDGDTILIYAVDSYDLKMVRLLVEELGANINVTNNNGDTLLMIAARSNNSEMIRLLVDLGADIEATDIDNNTNLIHAILYDGQKIVRLLIELGANIEATDDKGRTIIDILERRTEGIYIKEKMINIIKKAKKEKIEAKKEAFYLSMIKSQEIPKDERIPLTGLYDELSKFNPFLIKDISDYVFGEEESKRSDSGGRRRKSVRKKKYRSKKRKSVRKKKSRSKRIKKTRSKRK